MIRPDCSLKHRSGFGFLCKLVLHNPKVHCDCVANGGRVLCPNDTTLRLRLEFRRISAVASRSALGTKNELVRWSR
jgi:hypothetical protein